MKELILAQLEEKWAKEIAKQYKANPEKIKNSNIEEDVKKIVENAAVRAFFGSSDTLFYCINTKERAVEWTRRTGFGQQAIDYAQKISNIFVEYDRKMFKVWVPETTKSHDSIVNAAEYTTKLGLDTTFAYGGFHSYGSLNKKKKDAYGR